jgi:hypothetical protein
MIMSMTMITTMITTMTMISESIMPTNTAMTLTRLTGMAIPTPTRIPIPTRTGTWCMTIRTPMCIRIQPPPEPAGPKAAVPLEVHRALLEKNDRQAERNRVSSARAAFWC